jgi:GAF domain-containing protein
VNGETTLGVLQVLDRTKDRARSLGEIDLLVLFANQAAIGLDLLQATRRARAAAEQGDAAETVVARIAGLLERSQDDHPEGLRLLEALESVLSRLTPDGPSP